MGFVFRSVNFSFKVKILTATVLASFALGSHADGGLAGGGGGDAILCYKSIAVRQQISAAFRNQGVGPSTPLNLRIAVDLHLDQLQSPPQSLDYFETFKAQGLFSPQVPKPSVKSADEAYTRLNSEYPTFAALITKYITTEDQWVARDSGVILIDDATLDYEIPGNCLIAQVAYFDDTQKIVNYDARILSLMDDANRTALKLHEDLYSFYRAAVVERNNALDSVEHYSNCPANRYICTPMSYKISVVTSNPVRWLVKSMLTEINYASDAFKERVLDVAVGLHWQVHGIPLPAGGKIPNGWSFRTYVYRNLDDKMLTFPPLDAPIAPSEPGFI